MPEREDIETNISNELSKLLREHFGRGPRAAQVQLKPPFITVYLQDFLAPMEQTLLAKREKEGIQELRNDMMAVLLPFIQMIIETDTTYPLEEMYYDWNFEDQKQSSGMIWGILRTSSKDKEEFYWPKEPNKEVLEKKIASISQKVKKAPDEINMYWLGKNELLVEQLGVLVCIEQELIQSGQKEILKTKKRKLDKELFTTKILQQLLQRKIKDVFIDWSFQENKEYMIIRLEKER